MKNTMKNHEILFQNPETLLHFMRKYTSLGRIARDVIPESVTLLDTSEYITAERTPYSQLVFQMRLKRADMDFFLPLVLLDEIPSDGISDYLLCLTYDVLSRYCAEHSEAGCCIIPCVIYTGYGKWTESCRLSWSPCTKYRFYHYELVHTGRLVREQITGTTTELDAFMFYRHLAGYMHLGCARALLGNYLRRLPDSQKQIFCKWLPEALETDFPDDIGNEYLEGLLALANSPQKACPNQDSRFKKSLSSIPEILRHFLSELLGIDTLEIHHCAEPYPFVQSFQENISEQHLHLLFGTGSLLETYIFWVPDRETFKNMQDTFSILLHLFATWMIAGRIQNSFFFICLCNFTPEDIAPSLSRFTKYYSVIDKPDFSLKDKLSFTALDISPRTGDSGISKTFKEIIRNHMSARQ